MSRRNDHRTRGGTTASCSRDPERQGMELHAGDRGKRTREVHRRQPAVHVWSFPGKALRKVMITQPDQGFQDLGPLKRGV